MSKSDCVNPSGSFALGGVFMIVSAIAIYIYLFQGRLHRIAHARSVRLMKPCIVAASATSHASDLVSAVNKVLQSVNRSKIHHLFFSEANVELAKSVMFVVICLLMTFVVVLLFITIGASQILFNTLVIFRSYRLYFPFASTFADEATFLVESMFRSIGIGRLAVLAYPFIKIADELSKIHINLAAVNVSCAGAQGPPLLFLNLIIVGVVVIIIRSDAQVYWDVAQRQVLTKALPMVFNEYYVVKNRMSTVFFTLSSMILLALPSPRKVIQFMLSFVTVSHFFSGGGRSPSNANCDAAAQIFPVDTFLATLTTIIVYIAIFPVLYMLAQILVPCFTLEGYGSLLSSSKKRQMQQQKELGEGDDVLKEEGIALSILGNKGSKRRALAKITTPTAEQLEDGAMTVHSIVNPLTSSKDPQPLASISNLISHHIERSATNSVDSASNSSSRSNSTSGSSFRLSWSSSTVFSSSSTATTLPPRIRRFFSSLMRLVGSFLALDWFLLKAVIVVIRAMFNHYKEFIVISNEYQKEIDRDLTGQHDHEDQYFDTETTHRKYETEEGRTGEVHSYFQRLQSQIACAELPRLPWFLAWHDMLIAAQQSKSKQSLSDNPYSDRNSSMMKSSEEDKEKYLWRREKRRFPNYMTSVLIIRRELQAQVLRQFSRTSLPSSPSSTSFSPSQNPQQDPHREQPQEALKQKEDQESRQEPTVSNQGAPQMPVNTSNTADRAAAIPTISTANSIGIADSPTVSSHVSVPVNTSTGRWSQDVILHNNNNMSQDLFMVYFSGILCTVLLWLCIPASYAFPCQLFTRHGQLVWRRVLRNYSIIGMITIGVWTTFAVKEFQLLPSYAKYRQVIEAMRGNLGLVNDLILSKDVLAQKRATRDRRTFKITKLASQQETKRSSGKAELDDINSYHEETVAAVDKEEVEIEEDYSDDDDDNDDDDSDTESDENSDSGSESDEDNYHSGKNHSKTSRSKNSYGNGEGVRNPLQGGDIVHDDHKRTANYIARHFKRKEHRTHEQEYEMQRIDGTKRPVHEQFVSYIDHLVHHQARHIDDVQDAIVTVNNNERLAFQQYVAAMVSVRIVLLQLVPALTAPSILFVELSSSPIFVIAKKMRVKLTPIILKYPFQKAEELWKHDYDEINAVVPRWKVWFLGVYMFLRESRAIRMLLSVLENFVTLCLVFVPHQTNPSSTDGVHSRIHQLITSVIILLTFELFIQGISYSCYLILLLHRYLFPLRKRKTADVAVASPADTTDNDDLPAGPTKDSNHNNNVSDALGDECVVVHSAKNDEYISEMIGATESETVTLTVATADVLEDSDLDCCSEEEKDIDDCETKDDDGADSTSMHTADEVMVVVASLPIIRVSELMADIGHFYASHDDDVSFSTHNPAFYRST